MSEHPILFSGSMVRAILEERKTQTRRVIKPQPTNMDDERRRLSVLSDCPYGRPGSILWVRETWAPRCSDAEKCGTQEVIYKADFGGTGGCIIQPRWHPSIHMRRWASRLTLRLTNVRVQRLQEINGRNAVAEGIEKVPAKNVPPELAGAWSANDTVFAFARLWDSINAKRGYSWDSNPWVWALTFDLLAPAAMRKPI